MLINPVFDIWNNNKAVINGWLSIPNSFTAEAMSKNVNSVKAIQHAAIKKLKEKVKENQKRNILKN